MIGFPVAHEEWKTIEDVEEEVVDPLMEKSLNLNVYESVTKIM